MASPDRNQSKLPWVLHTADSYLSMLCSLLHSATIPTAVLKTELWAELKWSAGAGPSWGCTGSLRQLVASDWQIASITFCCPWPEVPLSSHVFSPIQILDQSKIYSELAVSNVVIIIPSHCRINLECLSATFGNTWVPTSLSESPCGLSDEISWEQLFREQVAHRGCAGAYSCCWKRLWCFPAVTVRCNQRFVR